MIDTHCHVDQFESPEKIARGCEREGIFTIAVTSLPSHYKLACKHLADFRYVQPALGMHPLAAREHVAEMSLFRKLITTARFVGEVGLDFSVAGRSSADQQIAAFDQVIRCAAVTFRIITLHSRGAEKEVLRCLEHHRAGPAIFHWYSVSEHAGGNLLGWPLHIAQSGNDPNAAVAEMDIWIAPRASAHRNRWSFRKNPGRPSKTFGCCSRNRMARVFLESFVR